MKKIFVIMLLVISLCFSGCTGSGDTDTSNGLTEIQKEISNLDCLIGISYLGYAEVPEYSDIGVYTAANGFDDMFPFIKEISEDNTVLVEGGALYVVVPADDSITLTISDVIISEETDYIPVKGEDYLTAAPGEPVLLRGNENMPNLWITAETDSGETLGYYPSFSGYDGLLIDAEYVYDFSPYDRILEIWEGYDPVPDPVYTLNTWYAREYDIEGNLYDMTLNLYSDGTATYSYGWPDSDVVESFEGIWIDQGDDVLEFELYGGPVEPDGYPIEGEQYDLTGEFSVEYLGSMMTLLHESGTPLLYGTEECYYYFMPFDGQHLVNFWRSESQYSDWYYDLQLFETGECTFTIRDAELTTLAVYTGEWYLTEDNAISLYLMLESGEHPESPELDFINGEYNVEKWDPEGLTISFSSGHILTIDMEADYEATFYRL
ncbi:MAG: hypothetical protein E7225_03275 [Clostridiales bacterium]|nr:hypothetical protein [Clostridiales bacterium]